MSCLALDSCFLTRASKRRYPGLFVSLPLRSTFWTKERPRTRMCWLPTGSGPFIYWLFLVRRDSLSRYFIIESDTPQGIRKIAPGFRVRLDSRSDSLFCRPRPWTILFRGHWRPAPRPDTGLVRYSVLHAAVDLGLIRFWGGCSSHHTENFCYPSRGAATTSSSIHYRARSEPVNPA